MPAKSLKLDGYGVIMINPINIKEKKLDTVDPTGNILEHKMVGSRSRSVYVTADGVELANSQVCKKISVDGEDLIIPKFQATKEVAKEDITETDDNGLMYRGIERKFYNAVTDNQQLKELVITQNKTLEFPFTAGNGWKMWKGVLTNWNNKLILVACRGDIQKELAKYDEQTVELELEAVPQQQNMKKLLKAMVV